MKKILIVLSTVMLLAASCYLDPFGYFGTHTGVRDRFTQSTNMAALADTIVSNTNFFSFIHITDTHYTDATNVHIGALQSHLNTNDAFIIITGDLVNTGREPEFQDYVSHLSNIGLPFYSSLGNHDLWHGGWVYYPRYIAPSVYSFVAGGIRFISLDSANATLGWEQTQWLISLLQNRTEDMCIIMMHFNLLPTHLVENGMFTDVEEVYYLMYQFEQYDVDVVLMGHTHRFDDKTVNGVRYIVGEELKVNHVQDKQFSRIIVSNRQLIVQRLDI